MRLFQDESSSKNENEFDLHENEPVRETHLIFIRMVSLAKTRFDTEPNDKSAKMTCRGPERYVIKSESVEVFPTTTSLLSDHIKWEKEIYQYTHW